MATIVKAVQLFFQEGTSDKVYNATLVDEGEGKYTVRVEWGRRGTPLNQGAKAVRVPLATAEKEYARVVREKTNKGYEAITDEAQPAAVAPPVGLGSASKAASRPGARVKLPQVAQLLNAIDEAALDGLLDDDGWVAQQKLDGVRLLAHVGEQVIVTNRRGQVASAPQAVTARLARLARGTIVDGELVGDCYWLFDLLADGGRDLRPLGYAERYRALATHGDLDGGALRLVPLASGARRKRALLARLERERAEGMVLKRADAPYRPGRPASGGAQLKHKFVKSADVFILENAGNAYRMGLIDERGRVREVGKVFAGTTNDSRRALDEALAAGERPVAEVRYLYATEDLVLYQPVFAQLRDDKEPEDCRLEQLQRTSRAVVALDEGEPGAARIDDGTARVLALLGVLPGAAPPKKKGAAGRPRRPSARA
jgi:bifunctional non-homologous end joining protein LigD